MKAVVSPSYGPLDTLTITDVAKPVPGPGEILLRSEAASLNRIDIMLTTGVMRDLFSLSHPFVPGVDVTGVVEAVGPGVTRFAVGDAVLAWNGARSGALAEYVLADEGPGVTARPAGLDVVGAAALPTAALTAATVLDAGKVLPGEIALVVGAPGGVGSFTVQLAKRAGARVFATGRPDDAPLLRSLGAETIIDYREDDLASQVHELAPGGADVVLDVVQAGDALAAAAAAAKPGGRLVSTLAGPPAFEREVGAAYIQTRMPEGRLTELAEEAATGRLHVEVGATYPFAEARSAFAHFAERHARGKIVITF